MQQKANQDAASTSNGATLSGDGRTTAADGSTAIVAARADQPPVETAEICELTEAAGYRVVDEFTQVRPRDPGTYLGSGKVAEIAERAEQRGADLLVVDGELTPTQTTTLQEYLSDRTRVFDRYRLILHIFGERARHRRAQLQVELARLRYDLPRLRETADEGMLNRRTERGTPVYDVRDRIDRVERKLEALPSPAEQFRERRREEGFDLVTLAGYTNAGKSTLLHRLADDLAVDEATPDHPDETAVAAIEDRLFKTLETTTRRATIRDRPTLVTDTVGFVQDLPHWLVRSFSETLSEASAADVVVLVVDASDSVATIDETLDISLTVLDEQGVAPEDICVALNKIDQCSPQGVNRRRRLVAERVDSVVPVSVREGTNLDSLRGSILDRLPTRSETLVVPNGGDAMALRSWLYDHTCVESVEYTPESVEFVISGRPSSVEKARARASEIGGSGATATRDGSTAGGGAGSEPANGGEPR